MQIQPTSYGLDQRLPVTEPGSLTSREESIIRLVVQGQPNRAIATQLFISVNTVKFHLKNIYSKLGVRSRTQAAWLYHNQY